MIDMAEFRKKSKEDLKTELEKVEGDIQKIVSDILQKKEKNVKKAGLLRKDVARIKTLLNEDRSNVEVPKEVVTEKKSKKEKKVKLKKEEK